MTALGSSGRDNRDPSRREASRSMDVLIPNRERKELCSICHSLLLMPGLGLVGHLLGWPLKIGTSDPVGIVLTIALVAFVNLVVYLLKKAWD